ncbi:MAG: hypothetical protein BHV67_05455 [Bacteroidales bacterium 43_36]|nr:MAG: hypothetical protein BHV67_05455 [Bacteroidales bacterium 43_36]
MRNIISLVAFMLMAVVSGEASPQQTLEEATDSIKNVLALAKKGDAVAQNEVGGWYYRGRHVKQNYEEALQWWAKSAKQGNNAAIGNMGLCYQMGRGVAADSLKASKLYIRSIKDGNHDLLQQHIALADKGNIFSNMLVAYCWQHGIGVDKDTAKAIPYLTAAAEKGCVIAQRDLALVFLNGKNAKDAACWFKKGADNDEISCIFYYGKLLSEGVGVPQNKKEGANYLLKAADYGFPQAMYYVGNCYMEGTGLTKNAGQAVRWYKSAAAKGISNAQWQLAQCYREGNGTPVNYDRALYWYAKCNSKGHARAFRKLVCDSIPGSPFVAYLKGMRAYSKKDFEAALKQFKIVEKAKIADGKVMEAVILANTSYARHNMKKAVKLLNEAAKTNAQAIYMLGALYEAGKGVSQNMPMAVEYMSKAAEMGYGDAECTLADMYFEGRGVDQNYEKAVSWYEKANAQGELTENAAKRYASCYENGWGGLEKDEEAAKSILKGDYKINISELLDVL